VLFVTNFNISLANNPTAAGVYGDILKPIIYGLQDCGYRAHVSCSILEQDAIQLIPEHFTNQNAFDALMALKANKIRTGCILTEDFIELSSHELHKHRLNTLLAAIPHFDFFWSMAPVEPWLQVIPADKICYLPVPAYNPKGRTVIEREKVKFINFLIYGKPTDYREQVRAKLQGPYRIEYSAFMVQGGMANLPDYVVASMMAHTQCIIDIPRKEYVNLASTTRLAFALQHSIPIVVSDRFNLDGTSFKGYVATHDFDSIEGVLAFQNNASQYLSEDFERGAKTWSAAWRANNQATKVYKEPIKLAKGEV